MTTTYVKKSGDIGIFVNKMQAYLNIMQQNGFIFIRLQEDGMFGSDTKSALKQFQAYSNILIDGVMNEKTWDALINKLKAIQMIPDVLVKSKSYYLTVGNRGLDVYKMQMYYNEIAKSYDDLNEIEVDGIYGSQTKRAITQYQYYARLPMDGLIGEKTWDRLVKEYLLQSQSE